MAIDIKAGESMEFLAPTKDYGLRADRPIERFYPGRLNAKFVSGASFSSVGQIPNISTDSQALMSSRDTELNGVDPDLGKQLN
nr:hypothetical protein [Sphingomonas bacterium]